MILPDKDYVRLEELLKKAWMISSFTMEDCGVFSTWIRIEHKANPAGEDPEASAAVKELYYLLLKICGFKDAIKKARRYASFSLAATAENKEWLELLPPEFRGPARVYLERGFLDEKGDAE